MMYDSVSERNGCNSAFAGQQAKQLGGLVGGVGLGALGAGIGASLPESPAYYCDSNKMLKPLNQAGLLESLEKLLLVIEDLDNQQRRVEDAFALVLRPDSPADKCAGNAGEPARSPLSNGLNDAADKLRRIYFRYQTVINRTDTIL